MANTISTGTIPKALVPSVKGYWGAFKSPEPQYPKLFKSEKSNNLYEEYVSIGGIGLASVKPEAVNMTLDDVKQGHTTRLTNVVYATGFIVSKEAISDGVWQRRSIKQTASLDKALEQTREYVCANIINRGTNSSYPVGDGQAFFSATHPHIKTTATWSNLLDTASDLCEAAVEDMITQMWALEDSNGMKRNVKPVKLVCHPAEHFNATRILKTPLQNDTSNNAINAIRNTGVLPGGHVTHSYFDDADAWGIQSDVEDGLIVLDRWPKELSHEEFPQALKVAFYGSIRFVPGVIDPACMFWTPGQ